MNKTLNKTTMNKTTMNKTTIKPTTNKTTTNKTTTNKTTTNKTTTNITTIQTTTSIQTHRQESVPDSFARDTAAFRVAVKHHAAGRVSNGLYNVATLATGHTVPVQFVHHPVHRWKRGQRRYPHHWQPENQ
jgi:hypothetical protein